MANAGRHNDTRILKKMIYEGLLIKITDKDYHSNPATVWRIKKLFNDIVQHDEAYNHKYNGKKYIAHSAWRKVDKALIRINQWRFNNWCFEPLSEKDLYRPKNPN